MLKWGLNFKAVFTIGERDKDSSLVPKEQLTIEYPYSVNMMIDSGVYSTSNTAQFQFINLGESDRKKLFLDIGNIGKKYIQLDFYAGYQNTMPLIFSGFAMESVSFRESGSCEWITSMQFLSAANFFRYGFINATFTEGTTLTDILKYATEGTELKLGYITPDIPPLTMNKTFIGQTLDLLGREYGGYNVFINNNELNILGENDCIEGEVEVITDSTGLLGTPKRANLFVEADLIFSPQFRTAQAVSLLSQSLPDFNGAYQISSVKHQGLISPSVAGKITTKLILTQSTSGEYRKIEKTPETTYQAPAKNINWQKPVSYTRVSDPYGWRIHPIKKVKQFHKGIDLAAPKDTPVYAASNGRVMSTQWADGYGKTIVIDHGNINGKTVISKYAHLNDYTISPNTQVAKGQQIGKVGTTGNSTGYHLHFEIKENGSNVNPAQYLGKF